MLGSLRPAVQDGVEAAYREHGATVLGFAHRFTGDRELAEDLTQEAFARLVREWGREGEPPVQPRAWLLAVTRNLALDQLARRTTAQRGMPDVPQRPSPVPPDACAQRRETEGILEAAIADLPEDLRAALILCAIEGLSYEEAAAVCRCTVKALSSRLGRARQRLRAQLGRTLLRDEEEATR